MNTVADYGEYISLFHLDHLIYIIGLVVIASAFFLNITFVKKHKTVITTIVVIIIIAQQILLYSGYYFATGHGSGFDLSEALPLHLSRINSILGLLFLLTRNRQVFSILTMFSLFAILSFIYPSQVYGITHPIGISFFVNHIVTLLLPFYGIIAYNMKIKPHDSLRALPWFIMYVAVAYITNQLTGGNYFYLRDKPVFASLPDVIYIPLSIVFAFVLFKLGEIMYRKLGPILKKKNAPLL